jgi:hypothetical protein
MHTDNLVQDILGGFQFELSKPYLFYRNKGRVNGIWFFEPEECEAIAQLVQVGFYIRAAIRICSLIPRERGSSRFGLERSETQPSVWGEQRELAELP